MAGLYPNTDVVERSVSGAVSAATLFPPFIAPADLEIIGMILNLGTAAGTNDGLTVNISDVPTSQAAIAGTLVSPNPYNLWTAANVPSIKGTATSNLVQGALSTTAYLNELIENKPYPLDMPIPGPAGTVGYSTAQATSQVTSNPVVSPPTIDKFGIISGIVAPDNTYTDANGYTSVPANIVHEGDVLSFVIAAISSLGSAANLYISLIYQYR